MLFLNFKIYVFNNDGNCYEHCVACLCVTARVCLFTVAAGTDPVDRSVSGGEGAAAAAG